MFAARCPLPIPRALPRYRKSKVCKSYFTIDENNTRPLGLEDFNHLLHVITFHQPNDDEGIYSLRKLNKEGLPENFIIAWRNFDDAYRYKTLLDAEMKRYSYIQFATHFELNYMCELGNYKCRVVNDGVLVTPPTETVQTTDWERRSALLNGRWTVREKDDTPPEWP